MVNNSVVLGMWDGRVGRMQYIFNYLFLIVISTVGLSIAGVLIGVAGNVGVIIGSILVVIFGLLYFLFAVSLILRRLHDFGQSGLWLLLYLLPFLGFLMSIILLVVAGDPGPNRVRRGQRQRYRRLFSVRQITATRARINTTL